MKKLVVMMLLCSALAAGCGQRAVLPETEEYVGSNVAQSNEKDEEKAEIAESSIDENESDGDENKEEATLPGEEKEEEVALDVQTETSLANNGGYFVKVKDKIFFHGPDAEGMQHTGLFGEYLFTNNGGTILQAYDLKTKETELLLDDHSYGGLYFGDGKLFINEYDEEKEANAVYLINTDGTDYHKLCDGTAVCAEKTGKYVAITQWDFDTAEIHVWSGEQEVGMIYAENLSSVLGIGGDYLVYETSDYEKQTQTVYSWNLFTGASFILGEIPFKDGQGGLIDQIEITDTEVYLAHGVYEGTGHFFAGGYYLKGELNQYDSLQVVEEVGSEDERIKMPAFRVEEGRMVQVEGVPMTAGVDQNTGEMGYYDELGKFCKVAEGYAYSVDEIEETTLDVEIVEYVDGNLYAVQNESWRAPEDDIGWREAYERKYTYIMEVDGQTGERLDIGYGMNPKLVEGDVDESF